MRDLWIAIWYFGAFATKPFGCTTREEYAQIVRPNWVRGPKVFEDRHDGNLKGHLDGNRHVASHGVAE